MNGSRIAANWPGRSAIVTSQDETIAAATNSITTEVVLADDRIISYNWLTFNSR
ncbi:hypothetical protein D3C78_1935460 [compost metagenome]